MIYRSIVYLKDAHFTSAAILELGSVCNYISLLEFQAWKNCLIFRKLDYIKNAIADLIKWKLDNLIVRINLYIFLAFLDYVILVILN